MNQFLGITSHIQDALDSKDEKNNEWENEQRDVPPHGDLRISPNDLGKFIVVERFAFPLRPE